MSIDLEYINAYKTPPRTKKIDVTPIRLEGDDDDEEGSDDDDEDEDEESTPVPRFKRHVARCVFLASFHTSRKLSPVLTSALHPRSIRKPTTKSTSMKPNSRQREADRAQDDGDDDDGSGASEPADSIIDSGSEEDADNEVDGMLGE